jgi:carnitine-CoA ligase
MPVEREVPVTDDSQQAIEPQVYSGLVPNFADPETWTLAHVLRHHAGARPEAVCLEMPEEASRWTYAEALELGEHVASSMYRSGARQGDRVILMAANSSEFVFTWWGTALGGLVEVPINTSYEGDFLRHQLQIADARFAVIDDVYAERWVALGDEARGIERFWVVDSGAGIVEKALALLRENGWEAARWEDLRGGDRVELPTPRAQDLGAIFYTSGTTGPSKGVAMPNSQLYFFAQIVVSLTRLTHDDVYLTTTPLFHGNATFMAVYPAIVAGGRAVVRSKFSASRWIDHVRDSGVTVTNFVGVMMDFAWKQPPRADDRDNRLRCVYAAPTASTIVEEFKARYDIEAFVDAFGLTETSAPIMSPYGVPRPPGAAGLANTEWFDIRLVDPETDREVEVGTIGELVVRPVHPWTSSNGYYNMPEKTVEAWRNLWFHTGDALRRDAEGWYYFVDRFKDALRRRGENISSYEVEQAILGHPSVLEAAVLGVPADQEAGEDEVLAVVVVGEPVEPAEVLEWCRGRIPAFAIPRYVRVVDALPKTPSEKVRKSALRDDGITDDTYDDTLRPARKEAAR